MRKIYPPLFVTIFLSLVIIIVSWLVPEYEHTFLLSEDGRYTVTRVNYDGQTYFTYGKHESNSIPRNYVRPQISGVTDGFEVILYFEQDTAVFYAHYGQFEKVGNNKKLKVKVYEGYGNDPLYYQMKYDDTGKYKVLHD